LPSSRPLPQKKLGITQAEKKRKGKTAVDKKRQKTSQIWGKTERICRDVEGFRKYANRGGKTHHKINPGGRGEGKGSKISPWDGRGTCGGGGGGGGGRSRFVDLNRHNCQTEHSKKTNKWGIKRKKPQKGRVVRKQKTWPKNPIIRKGKSSVNLSQEERWGGKPLKRRENWTWGEKGLGVYLIFNKGGGNKGKEVVEAVSSGKGGLGEDNGDGEVPALW